MEIIQGAPESKRSRYWALYMLRPDESVVFGPGEYTLSSLRASVAYAQRRYGKRFTTRLLPDRSIRVWRVDKPGDFRVSEPRREEEQA